MCNTSRDILRYFSTDAVRTLYCENKTGSWCNLLYAYLRSIPPLHHSYSSLQPPPQVQFLQPPPPPQLQLPLATTATVPSSHHHNSYNSLQPLPPQLLLFQPPPHLLTRGLQQPNTPRRPTGRLELQLQHAQHSCPS